MQRVFSSFWFSLSLIVVGCLISTTASAQVSADGTTSTTVNQDGDSFTIEQGDRTGDNLFHSFDQFSVPTKGSAAFNNAGDIANIFSRVTGSNISNIDGLLSANGAANFYLINPNGIIFGENASLNLGGSFFASTADSLLFEGGEEFSASNSQGLPLLDVSIPIGATFRDNSEDIVNRSIVQNDADEVIGLEVSPGNNLTFVGGNLNFEGGNLTASGGDIELGAVSKLGIVNLNEDGSLNFPESLARADISLSNAAELDVQGNGEGNITVQANNLDISEESQLVAGIEAGETTSNAFAGNITLSAAETISLNQESAVINQVEKTANGNAGNIFVEADALTMSNGANISTITYAEGNGILVEDLNSQNFGTIQISVEDLMLESGALIRTSTFGSGNAGDVIVNARNSVSLDGVDSEANDFFPSGVYSHTKSYFQILFII